MVVFNVCRYCLHSHTGASLHGMVHIHFFFRVLAQVYSSQTPALAAESLPLLPVLVLVDEWCCGACGCPAFKWK